MVDGTMTRSFKFRDPDTLQEYVVEMPIKEGIHLKLIEDILIELKRINVK